jgi:hypothetical protein
MLLGEFYRPNALKFSNCFPMLLSIFSLFIVFFDFTVTLELDVVRKVDYEENSFAVFHRISDLFFQLVFLETLRFFFRFELDYQVQEPAC